MSNAISHSIKPNGLKPKSYGDVVAIASLLAMFMSVVMWGLKLENRNDQLRDELSTVRAQVGRGVLPRAEERLKYLEHDVKEIQDHIKGHVH